MRSSRRSGYTLVELMVVVAIIGTLIALALPGFRGYVMRTRVAEAPRFLGEIRLREEAYRAEFYQYCATAFAPGAIPAGGDVADFPVGLAGWASLGALPDGPVRFRYRVDAGTPGVPPPLVGAIPGMDSNDFTFVAQAEADLDADSITMAVEAYSESDRMYMSYGLAGPPLGPGWE